MEELKKIDDQLAESSKKISEIKTGGTTDVATRVIEAQKELAETKAAIS